MNAIYILWLRQLKRFLRSRARLIGSLGQPLLFLVALGFGFGPIYAKAGGGNYIQFLAPGIICMTVLFTAIFTGIDIIWDRQFGFLKETLVAPVSRYTIMLGRTFGGATVSTIQGSLVFIISLIAGFRPVSWAYVPLALVLMFVIAILFTALGTAIASVLQDMQGFQLIMNFLVMPLFFLSGALFPLQGLPPVVTVIAMMDPLSYGVDAMRYALTLSTHFGLALDIIVLGACVIVLTMLGGYLFSKTEV